MKSMLISILSLVFGAQMTLSAADTVVGHVGGTAVITCPYKSGYENNLKYLCRGDCRYNSKDIRVETQQGNVIAKSGRFYLHDNTSANVFTITITGLTSEDSGKYQCAVKTPWYTKDSYRELWIVVKPARVVTERPVIITELSTTQTLSPELETTGVAIVKTWGPTSNTTLVVSGGPTDTIAAVCALAGVAIVLVGIVGVPICIVKQRKKGPETTSDPMFLYTGGGSSSKIISERGTFAGAIDHTVPTVHLNIATIISSVTSSSQVSTTTTTTTTSSSNTLISPSSIYATPVFGPRVSSAALPQSEQIYANSQGLESVYQRMAPLMSGEDVVPIYSVPTASTVDRTEYVSMQNCRNAS